MNNRTNKTEYPGLGSAVPIDVTVSEFLTPMSGVDANCSIVFELPEKAATPILVFFQTNWLARFASVADVDQ